MNEDNVIVPNIFDNGTSELKTTVFIEWLLKWSAKKLKSTNEALHSCACEMLELFFDKKFDVDTIEIYKGTKNVDFWFVFNSNKILVIEDKYAKTSQDNLLKRYKRYIEEWCNEHQGSYDISYVYYKTDDYRTSELNNVKKSGFKAINRGDILRLLGKYYKSADNDFLTEYYMYLSNIENKENEVFEKSFNEINQSKDDLMIHMKGFCNYFATKIDADFAPAITYVIMFWNRTNWEHSELFLEFENFDLKIKLRGLDIIFYQKSSEFKKTVLNKISKVIKKHDYKISIPNKIKFDNTMTIASIEESMWLSKDSEGKIDKEETLKKLKSLNNITKEIVSA